MAVNVKLVSRQMMNTVLADKKFLESFNELAAVAGTIKSAAANTRGGGCRGCRKRRIEYNAFNQFLEVVKQLPPTKLAAFKKHVGATTLLYNAQNPKTGRYENGRL